MSHFAKVVDGVVVQVIVAEKDFVDTQPGYWVQTSYNTHGGIHYEVNSSTPSADQTKALRKNYAGIGYTYDSQRDAFIAPQPYPSWDLNEETCRWDSPVAYPTDGKIYRWDEATTTWIEVM